MRIKDISDNEKPRERLLRVGSKNLSNEELLSIIIKNGTKNNSAKEIAGIILKQYKSIYDLKNATVNTLSKIKGIGTIKAIEIIASLELGKRVYYTNEIVNIKMNSPKIIYKYFKNIFYLEEVEVFYVLYLDIKNNLITYEEMFRGTVNNSLAHPREIFKKAILESSSFIIVIHNHPSNDTYPSDQDIAFTQHLYKGGEILGIPVLDHIIIGKDNYYSFHENENIKS